MISLLTAPTQLYTIRKSDKLFDKENQASVFNKTHKNQHFDTLKGQKLSLLMFNGNISSRDTAQTIGIKEIKAIQEVLESCRYTKLPAMLEPEKIQITQTSNGLNISNFDTPDTEFINGVCGELAPKVIKKLEEKCDEKLLLGYATGMCQKYNMRHAFIIALKNTPENKETFETIVNNYKIITEMILPMYEDLTKPEKTSDPAFIEKMQEVMKQAQKLVHKPVDLKNAIIIDPSFGVIINPDNDFNFEGYYIQTINKLANAVKIDTWAYEPFSNESEKIPIGYLKNIAPELLKNYSDKSLLFMAIKMGTEAKDSNVCIYVAKDENDINPERILEIESKLTNDNPLKNFIKVIKAKLQSI